jgi:hypothetical protein
VGDGGCLRRTNDRRCAAQFGILPQRCALRFSGRRRIAILLVDNAQSHRVGKSGLVRAFLDAWPGKVVLVFLPPYRICSRRSGSGGSGGRASPTTARARRLTNW